MCGQDFVQKSAAEHQKRVAASAKPATTRLTLIPLIHTPPVVLLSAPRRVQRSGQGMEGVAVWLRIVKAIEELLSEERPDDAEVH